MFYTARLSHVVCASLQLSTYVLLGPAQSDLPACVPAESQNAAVCRMSLTGSPPVYGLDTATDKGRLAMSRWIREVYVKEAEPCLSCDIHFTFGGRVLERIDFGQLRTNFVNLVTSSREQISYQGFSSGMLLVTTVPKNVGGKLTYYQFELMSDSDCAASGNVCGILGSTLRVTVDANGTHRTNTDALCQQVETDVSQYLFNLISVEAKRKD
jgi:hypothetical protein